MLAIELKVSITVSAIADVEDGRQTTNVGDDGTDSASVSCHELPSGIRVSGKILDYQISP